MSLALVQDYSSPPPSPSSSSSSDSDQEAIHPSVSDSGASAVASSADGVDSAALPHLQPTPGSPPVVSRDVLSKASASLPSAASVFSEVTGPPDYLKDSMGDFVAVQPRRLPQKENAIAVKEAKPQLVGSYERVRADQSDSKQEYGKLTAGMPHAEDAARLLGMCPQCAVPKTYSAVKEGLVCPVCKDQLRTDNDAETKKRSRIKDKERSKRMKGQSSHATWKSETEMQLRQQFD